jgi:hypothetical protein
MSSVYFRSYWLIMSLAALSAVAVKSTAENVEPRQSDKPVRLPPATVLGTNEIPQQLSEDQPFGPNDQPEWTTRRRFATTRVYVLPPWQFEFEQWWKGQWPREGKANQLFQSEVGIGLPYRFQLDLYENLELPEQGNFQHQGVKVEGRWALANWGKLPLNPTLYGEWAFNDDTPDKYEVKLLLGDDLAPRLHWGLNMFYEQEVSGERGSELGLAQALSYTAIDEKLSFGVEMKFERTSGPNLNGLPAAEFDLGPSIQWRPTPRMHLDLVPLFGVTSDSPRVEAWVVFGFDFGRDGNHTVLAPTSSRSR